MALLTGKNVYKIFKMVKLIALRNLTLHSSILKMYLQTQLLLDAYGFKEKGYYLFLDPETYFFN